MTDVCRCREPYCPNGVCWNCGKPARLFALMTPPEPPVRANDDHTSLGQSVS